MCAVLDFCKVKRRTTEVRDFLQHNFGLKQQLIGDFLEQLIDFQLLIADFQPNIIGADYFQRIGYPAVRKDTDYLISEREVNSGHLSSASLQSLPEAINFLSKHAFVNQQTGLKDFKDKFLQRFEHNEIPLLTAIDPELGLGYQALENDKQEDELIQELKAQRPQRQQAENLKYTPLYRFMLNEMMEHNLIQLHHFKEPGNEQPVPVANTISVILQYADEYIIAEHLGGSTANSLLGRFSLASDELNQLCKGYVQTEQEANPGVLFFDIAYQHDKKADNVNRRKAIYPYELPILSWTDQEQIIDLNDIIVSIKGDELVLHSLKYGKRIVPKPASAYNYTRSDLAVYRFLADLQYQRINSSLAINLKMVFPGLSRYPRVQYKNIILSAAKWLVPKTICTSPDNQLALGELVKWLASIQLEKPFKCGAGDQTLLFNPKSEEDLLSFVFFCKNKTALYIEETFIPAAPVVSDEYKQPYISEFIVNLEHKEKLYPAYSLNKTQVNSGQRALFLPGEEWLYFEIYCHPSRASSILIQLNIDFLNPFKKLISNFFFIRYSHPSFHIRLRVKVKDIKNIQPLLSAFSALLRPMVISGIVKEIQVKTYEQETDRYGKTRMDLVEKCFGINSDFILSLLPKKAVKDDLYILSLRMIENIWEKAGFSLQDQLSFAGKSADSFAAELNIQPDGFKKINLAFKDFSIRTSSFKLNLQQEKKALKTEVSFLKVLDSCTASEKYDLLSHLFHMHTNRLFENDQRVHEMVLYYYLTKKLKMKIGRLKQQK